MKSVQFVIALVSLSILAVYVLATDVFATDSLPDETEVEKRLNQWAGAVSHCLHGRVVTVVDLDRAGVERDLCRAACRGE